ncbi:hypothetical protein COLO4_25448 [Corchorus olitorius]|uniref:Uncharacterized protein n=1 Tax=Corchorus olitorius TaxID=93759 RepID=A0A1R3I2I8_9ROSI|nr:hypothetical protein COLO4_25448 [Corchorus olitorius]
MPPPHLSRTRSWTTVPELFPTVDESLKLPNQLISTPFQFQFLEKGSFISKRVLTTSKSPLSSFNHLMPYIPTRPQPLNPHRDEGVSEGSSFLSVLTSGSCCERALTATVPCWTKEGSDLAFEANRMKATV